MANDPKKKTENAADAPLNSGPAAASTPPASSPGDVKDQEQALQARIERLEAELADREGFLERAIAKLGESIGAGVAKALAADREAQRPGQHKKPPKRVLPDEFKGPRTYIVGASKAYQNGRLFQAGEKITVVDQFPARDWKPVEEDAAPAPKTAPASKPARAADQSVG